MKNIVHLYMNIVVLLEDSKLEKIFAKLHHLVISGFKIEGIKNGPDHGGSIYDRYYQLPTEEDATIMATVFGCGSEFSCEIVDNSEAEGDLEEVGSSRLMFSHGSGKTAMAEDTAEGPHDIPCCGVANLYGLTPKEQQGPQKWTLFWRGGQSEVVEGDAIHTAMNNAGYGAGALGALDFYEKEDKTFSWKWNRDIRSWDKVATHAEDANFLMDPIQKEGIFRFDSIDIRAMVAGGCSDRLVVPLSKSDITESYNKLIRRANPVEEVCESSLIEDSDWSFKGEVQDSIITEIGCYTMIIKSGDSADHKPHECRLWVVKKAG